MLKRGVSVRSSVRRIPKRNNGANPDTLVGGVVTEVKNSCPVQDEAYPYPQWEEIPEVIITDTLITIFGPDELRKASVAEINSKLTSGIQSVNDPRLGATEKFCGTCHFDRNQCPGHLGHINLSVPIYHPYFIGLIIRVLKCVCICCACPYIPIEQYEERGFYNFTGVNRLKAIGKASESLTCRTVGETCTEKPIFRIKSSKEEGKIMYKTKKGRERELPIEKVRQILSSISDEVAQAFLFENGVRPEYMILTVFPVIPPNTRPIIYKDGVAWHDDLTKMYIHIISANLAILNASSEKERKEKIADLIFSVQHFIDNTDGKYSQAGRKDMQSIHQRIVSKKGVLRGFLMGKRVNYSARTPISPDPSLRFGQIRIPKVWAPFLTHPVTIFSINKQGFQKQIDYAIANNLPIPISYYTPSSGRLKGKRVAVTPEIFKKFRLRDGDIIERWLKDGDRIIGNRNPTLHKQGFMAFEVVLGDPLTVGLHLSYTTPMNADFDGDEINIHSLQTLTTQEELNSVMNVRNCIMNAQSNKPAVGVVYDGLVGAFLLTQDKVEVDAAVKYDCYMLMTQQSQLRTIDERCKKKFLSINSGKALFSALLPEDFYYNHGGVLIRDGVLITGVITKSHIGPTPGSIIQVLYRDYGELRTVEFLSDASFVLARWLTQRGYTISLEDCYPKDPLFREKIEQEIAKIKAQVEDLGGSKLNDPIEEERRERQIAALVDIAKSLGMKIGNETLGPENNFKIAVASGAKGTDYNIGQITGILGQQVVKGGRIPYTLTNATRCLPYFKEGELDPEARGFCVNSFLTGLSPAELFFHQAATRETVMESSVKTPVSGTIQDVIAKAFESFVVAYDGSVRDAENNIIQYVYGNEGFAAEEVERVKEGQDEFTFFINLERIVGRINSKYGYEPEVNKKKVEMEEEKEIFEIISEEVEE